MSSSFLPSFHYTPASEKLKPKWALEAIHYLYHNMDNKSLLSGKNVTEIDGYANGDFSMKPFRGLFKSQRKRMELESQAAFDKNTNNPLGIDFTPLPLFPEKLNSAESIVAKIPVEVSCVANDPLAVEKRKEDINFIKNKPLVEAEIQDVADRLGLGEVDLGTTQNSSTPFSDSPFGLDLENPDEEDIFVNLLYALKIESAFEVGLQGFYDLTKAALVRRMEIKDQFRYAVSARESYQSPFTGLPEVDYVYPDDLITPDSRLPDYSDNTHRIRRYRITPLQMLQNFGGDIRSKEHLNEIINDKSTGYCACNNREAIHESNFGNAKVDVLKFEVVSVDSIGIAKTRHKKGYTSLTEDLSNSQDVICLQNTYSFYWVENTDHVFGIKRLGFSYRTKGKESVQNFTTQIYRTNKKSAVELGIGENKKAQIADIKMQHALIKSLPAGRYIDLKFLRGAVGGLTQTPGLNTIDDLVRAAMEDNVLVGDTTEGFDGKNDGQLKPVIDLPGGLKTEVIGYLNVIASANQAISRITGINEQLTGQSANPEGLIGLQKLLINSSLNALYYCNEAMSEQDQKMFTTWANIIKQGIEEGGKTKEAIIDMIGSRKANVIDGLNDVRLHDIGVKVRVGQREEERALFENQRSRLAQKGVLSAADEFMVNNIRNPKDQYAYLATKEQKWKKEEQIKQQQQYEQQQQLVAQSGENAVAAKKAESEGDIQTTYAKGDVQQKVIQLAAELGIRSQQIDAIVKSNLQRERNKSQADKNIATLQEKANLEQQEALV